MFQPAFHGSGMMDIGMPVTNNPSNNAISARTPPEHENLSTDHFNGMNFTPGPVGVENVDYNDFLNFNNDTDWSLPLDEGAHGESGGFMGDMNWIDQAPGWSRLNSPLPDSDLFGIGDRITEVETHA